MRSTLFFIPHAIAGLPVFGGGWLLIAWAVFSVLCMIWLVRRHGWSGETRGYVPFLLLVAAVIYFLLPMLEVRLPGRAEPLGLPIRGYGVLLLLGVVSGVLLAVHRGRQVGIHPDRIYALAFWMFILGIAGARLVFVIQYWDTFRRDSSGQILSWGQTLLETVKFTEGGLVVYGSVIGGAIAFVLYTRRHALPTLRLADVIAPSMILGAAIGRLGCLLNGCCFGGVCEEGPIAIHFPRYSVPEQGTLSPPYLHQLSLGQLHGIRVGEVDGQPIISWVRPHSAAAETGLAEGLVIQSINGYAVDTLEAAREVLAASRQPRISIESGDVRSYEWSIVELPDRSLPVHPAQLYSAINALLLFALLWSLFPFRACDGVVFGVLMTLYPITRFLLEIIRDDETGRWLTGLTISQNISLIALVLMAGYWYHVFRRPRLRESRESRVESRKGERY